MLLLLALACNDPRGRGPKGTVDLEIPALVPVPALVHDGAGSFTLTADTTISAEGEAVAVADLLAADLRISTGLPLPIAAGGAVQLSIAPGDRGAEGYTLVVTEDGVEIVGEDAAGLFYGTQTLRQLLSPWALAAEEQDVDWAIPAARIEDAPRFAWRGFMLDVARHFFTVEEVKRQIDVMALHKLNRLHLHLTDDQGWRIEIQSWPDLAEIGGATEVGGGAGGYYTQADYAELVAYAAARHVTVVPEIDFPGHAHAARASYAELNESGERLDPYTGEGVISTPLWLEGASTLAMVEDVWREVAALTPGSWVHVGGDEAVDIDDASYRAFVQWMQDTVTAEGKVMLGWDEIGPVELDAPFGVQHWYDERRARTGVEQGGWLISSPAEHAYLDMRHDHRAEYGQVWAGYVDVEAAYAWDPVPAGVDEAEVAGVEGALWTEFITDETRVDEMAWPRLAALAELGWSPDDQTLWPTFSERLGWHGARLEVLGVGYYRSRQIDWVDAADAR